MAAPRIRADYDGLAQIAKIFSEQAEQTRAMLSRKRAITLGRPGWVGYQAGVNTDLVQP